MIAMLASVTVSMGELTTGDVNLIFFVRCVARMTCKSKCELYYQVAVSPEVLSPGTANCANAIKVVYPPHAHQNLYDQDGK